MSADPHSPWAPANLKVLIPLVYAVPLLFLYALTIVVVLAKLRGPFHRLFAVTGITDVFSWILSYVLRRAKAAPLFFDVYESLPSEGSFVTFVVFAYYYALYAQLAATFFLTSSRLTAVLLPLKHRKIWARFIRIAYAIIALLPLPFTWNIYLCDCKIEKENPARPWEGYRWVMTKEACWKRRTIVTGAAEIIHLFLVLSMSVAVFVRMYQLRRRLEAFTEAKDDRRDSELKLLLLTCILLTYSIVNVAIEDIYGILEIVPDVWKLNGPKSAFPALFYFMPYELEEVVDLLFTVQALALDLHTLTAPVLLIFMSTAARQELYGFVANVGTQDQISAFTSRQRHSHAAFTESDQ